AAVAAVAVAAAVVVVAVAAAATGVDLQPAHAALTHTTSETIEPGVRLTRLDNGLRVVTEHLPHARSVALGCWVDVGNRDEPEHLSGASHFLEHLAFKGTARRDARAIAEAVDATGGEMNAFTTKEYTGYELRLPAQHLSFAIDLLCDVVRNPALRPDDVDAERSVILEELHLQNDEPDDVVHTELYDALFPGHP